MAVESKVMDHIRNVLELFGNKYFTKDGVLKRNAVIEDLDNYDKDLMIAILSDDLLHETYTTKIADVDVFEVNKFVDMLRYKEYWEDSFTKYNNKIGLTVDGRYIDDSSDVVLDFPYKDCVLKAGMTKEDVEHSGNANEPFLNETLAKPEIDELLEPKIFVNAKKYDKSGNKSITEITEKDNLIIKGNNLIALYSLKERYLGKIKLIYLDPPYNTGNDSFAYNDSFNHSAWLTFMMNRLQICKELLSEDGHIIIQTDDNEQAYLKVMMDSVFGRKNYVNTISVLFKNIAGASGGGEDKRLKKNIEYLTLYARNYAYSKPFNDVYDYKQIGSLVKEMRQNGISWKYTSVLVDPGSSDYMGFTYDAFGNKIKLFRRNGYKIKTISQLMEEENLSEIEAYNKYGSKAFQTAMPQSSIRPRVMEKYKELSDQPNGLMSIKYIPRTGKNKGKEYEQFYKGSKFRLFAWLKDVSVEKGGNLYKKEKQGTFWNFVGATKNVNKEGQVTFLNGKKPEELLSRIINMTTNTGETVLDMFLGSGSTAATALKLNRKFIGIEQIDYQIDLVKTRLVNTVGGEQTGISKDVNWQGGGSFIYAELMEKNQSYLKDIQTAKDIDDLMSVYARMKQNSDIDFRVDLDKFESSLKAGELPSFSDRKKELIKIIDKNQLYYNYSNIDDANVKDLISDSDYKFNKSFYSSNEVGEE